MDIESIITGEISKAFSEVFSHPIGAEDLSLQPTRREFEGKYTFVIFPYLKYTQKNPEESGRTIGEFVTQHSPIIKGYNVVKGFLNLEIEDDAWLQMLKEIYAVDNYGQSASNGKNVMVEFSSPNTNKPLHLGHLRTIFLGDSMSRILTTAGYEVNKTNLVNDRGIHICKSMLTYQKYGNGESPDSTGIKGDKLIGNYYVKFDKEYKKEIAELESGGMNTDEAKKQAPLILEAQEMLKKWEMGDEATVALWEMMNEWVYAGFDITYSTIGVTFDKFYYESETYLLGKNLVDEGLEKGIFFKKGNGSVWVDLTEYGLDEKLILRADGTSVYMTQDMGTCELKHKNFPFDKSVYVVGNEQDYHFQVLFLIMKKLGRPYAEGLHHLSYGMVDLPTGKMKSREGTVVDADDLMQEMFETAERHTTDLGKNEGLEPKEANELYKMLGLGALKYFLLRVDPKKRILFDPIKSIDFHGDTGPFIQYTYARISAIIRRAKTLHISTEVEDDIVFHKREADLIYQLSKFPEIIKDAGEDYSPALLAQYIFDVAKDYNGFYQEVPIFSEDVKALVKMRIALSEVTARVLKSGMAMLSIQVPERM
ncbi:MAG: arginine--tRNA ligase [Cytophagales bacterium]|nr:arginine--tRNA ligase [Cytophagales bacterium]